MSAGNTVDTISADTIACAMIGDIAIAHTHPPAVAVTTTAISTALPAIAVFSMAMMMMRV